MSPTIGIARGSLLRGQVLVLYDMLGITARRIPRFVRDFMAGARTIGTAAGACVEAVKTGALTAPEHCV